MTGLLSGADVPWDLVSGDTEPPRQADPVVVEAARQRRAARAAAVAADITATREHRTAAYLTVMQTIATATIPASVKRAKLRVAAARWRAAS